MARTPIRYLQESEASTLLHAAKVNLTLTRAEASHSIVGVCIAEFITYSQNTGFTRLNLTGGKVLDVKETTDQIDRLVRVASSQPNSFATDTVVFESA